MNGRPLSCAKEAGAFKGAHLMADGRRTYNLIAFDMDGTLLDSEKRLHAPVLEAIRQALEAGKRVALSTGRTRTPPSHCVALHGSVGRLPSASR